MDIISSILYVISVIAGIILPVLFSRYLYLRYIKTDVISNRKYIFINLAVIALNLLIFSSSYSFYGVIIDFVIFVCGYLSIWNLIVYVWYYYNNKALKVMIVLPGVTILLISLPILTFWPIVLDSMTSQRVINVGNGYTVTRGWAGGALNDGSRTYVVNKQILAIPLIEKRIGSRTLFQDDLSFEIDSSMVDQKKIKFKENSRVIDSVDID